MELYYQDTEKLPYHWGHYFCDTPASVSQK